jgi:protein dithiol oxidoreductase (disulfide-forming)
MMNIHKTLRAGLAAAATVLLMAAFSAQAAVTLTEGVNYKLIEPAVPPSSPPGKVEVVEVFWYACGHCYLLEPKLETWARTGKAPYVDFVRQPATWNDVLKTHARVFYTAELLGKLPQLHADIFREVNLKGNRLDTPESIEAYFVSRGVPKADFQKAFSSFAVESKVRRADDLNRRYRITGTPTVIVNGKYMTDVGMAGSEENLFQVINALAAKDRPKG